MEHTSSRTIGIADGCFTCRTWELEYLHLKVTVTSVHHKAHMLGRDQEFEHGHKLCFCHFSCKEATRTVLLVVINIMFLLYSRIILLCFYLASYKCNLV